MTYLGSVCSSAPVYFELERSKWSKPSALQCSSCSTPPIGGSRLEWSRNSARNRIQMATNMGPSTRRRVGGGSEPRHFGRQLRFTFGKS